MPTLLIIGGIIVLLLVISIWIYNSMISMRSRVDEAWSGIDVQLERRHDLVPNLVETVKGYAAHERDVLERTAKARAEAVAASGPRQAGEAESNLGSALIDLRAVAERYPNLRAAENFQQLTAHLSELEDEIQAARRIYNSNVQTFNTKVQTFPNSIVAVLGRFAPKELFELSAEVDRQPISVKYS